MLAAKLLRAGGQDDVAEIVALGSLLAAANTLEIAAARAEMALDHGFADRVKNMDEIFEREGTVSATPVPGLALGIWGMSVQNIRGTK